MQNQTAEIPWTHVRKDCLKNVFLAGYTQGKKDRGKHRVADVIRVCKLIAEQVGERIIKRIAYGYKGE